MSFNYGLRQGTVLKLTSGSSSSASAAFTAGTEYIRVVSTIACHILVAGTLQQQQQAHLYYQLTKLKLLKFLQVKK